MSEPDGYICGWCEEPILEAPAPFLKGAAYYHHACAIRLIAGSVGHQLHRCSCYGGNQEDPPGLSKREAALAAFTIFQMQQRLNTVAAEFLVKEEI